MCLIKTVTIQSEIKTFKPVVLTSAGAPCLSFDVVRDGEGEGREQFPLSLLLCAGTQADTALSNR